MNYQRLNDLKFETKERWGEVKRQVVAAQIASRQLSDDFGLVLSGITEAAVSDIPDSVSEFEFVHQRMTEMCQLQATALAHLQEIATKSQALAGHGGELAEGVLHTEVMIESLAEALLRFEEKDVLLKSAINAIEILVAADDKAAADLLGVIGEERVRDWLGGC